MMVMIDHEVNLQFSPKVTTKSKQRQANGNNFKQTHLIVSNQKYDFSMTDSVCGTVKQFCFALDFLTTPTYSTNETFLQHCHIKTMKKIVNGLKHMRLAPQTKFPNANETRGYI